MIMAYRITEIPSIGITEVKNSWQKFSIFITAGVNYMPNKKKQKTTKQNKMRINQCPIEHMIGTE